MDTESALEPELPIIDPHHHLWGESHGSHYMPDEFLADAGDGHHIVASVFLECGSNYLEQGPEHLRCVGEAQFANRVAQEAQHASGATHLCAGIVAHADLMLGAEVVAVLDALREAAPERLKGIRRMTAWDPDPRLNYSAIRASAGMLGAPAFRAGFAELQKTGLVFDAWVYHTQLEELQALACSFPETTIVLDHTGTPLRTARFAGRESEVRAHWQAGMAGLASCPNVTVKIGGLGTPLYAPARSELQEAVPQTDRLAASTRAYCLRAIDAFSPARCMFESNFPVERPVAPYRALWNGFKRLTAGFSVHERQHLFYGTAARTYGISIPAGNGR